MNTLFRMNPARRRVAMALAVALAVPAALPLATATAGHFSDTEELTAQDNIGAALAYSSTTFTEPVAEVVLGRDDVFADSLASGLLQATRPLLLTNKDTLSEQVKAELGRLSPDIVHVLGGEGAIAPAVVQALEAEDYTVQRHSGPTRIDTAVAVAKALGASATRAIIARANGTEDDETKGFADSLAAGGWAADQAMPVLLTETDKLSDPVANHLKDSAIKEVFVVGGQAAVSETVVTQLTAMGMTVKRVSGPTRFHTALAIAAERGFSSAADAAKVILTEGQAADAWAAGFAAAARSAKEDAPIVLAVGTEVPEPTMTFLGGTAGEPEPDPTETPTEAPTETPTEDPTETPTPDPSESPTPDPSESPAPGEGGAALICGPKLAIEACDAAATALGHVAGGGTQIVTFTATAVSRFDHMIGKVAEPRAANELSVTGCGYTNEPIFMEADGTFYLMMAGDQGTCSAEFTVATSAGPKKQTVELTIGDNFTPASVLDSPELVVVRPVKEDDEGVHVRFVFDEPVAPAPEIESSNFQLVTYQGEPVLPSAVFRDPRNPRAVLAVFSAGRYANSTTAIAVGGAVCAGNASGTPCAGASETDKASNGDYRMRGAVHDLDKFPNPSANFGLRTLDRTETTSDDVDLLSVGDYRASDQSLVFTFSREVDVPSDAEVGAATVLLRDGTIKSSDLDGWSAGPDASSLRVSFAEDGLSAAEMEQARRAMVDEDVVPSRDDADVKNTPVAVIIAGGGISELPDFVDIEDEDLKSGATRKVTFVFEEDLFEINRETDADGKFVAVLANGTVAYPEEQPDFKEGSKREVVVGFHESGDTAIDDTVLYYTVLTEAVKSFSIQQWNFADTIRRSVPRVYAPGRTDAPDLSKIDMDDIKGTCSATTTSGTQGRFKLALDFDEDISTTAPSSFTFEIWFTQVAPSTAPRVVFASGTATELTRASKTMKYEKSGANPGGLPPPSSCDHGAPAEYTRAKYLAIRAGNAQEATGGTLLNYPAGMSIPN